MVMFSRAVGLFRRLRVLIQPARSQLLIHPPHYRYQRHGQHRAQNSGKHSARCHR